MTPTPNECPRYAIKQSDDEAPVLELGGNVEYFFLAIAPRSTLALSGRICLRLIYKSNRTIWHLNCVQTNELCQIKLLEIELFDCLTMCKQLNRIMSVK